MTVIYTVTVEFDNQGDAKALAEIIEEFGFEASVSYRTLDSGPRTPIRETRLGRLILRHMSETPNSTFEIEDIAALLEDHEYKASSAAPALAVLAQQGDIVRVDRGQYRLR